MMPLGGEGGEGSDGSGGHIPEPEYGLGIEGPGRFRIRQGGSVDVPIQIQREGGYEGPVQVSARRLPPGIISSTVVLTGKETKSAITLLAAGDAAVGGPQTGELSVDSVDGELSDQAKFELIVAGLPGAIDSSFGQGGILKSPVSEVVGVAVDAQSRIWVAANDSEATTPSGLLLRATDAGAWENSAEFSPVAGGRYGTLLYSFAFTAGGPRLGVIEYMASEAGTEHGVLGLNLDGQFAPTFGEAGFASLGPIYSILPRADGSAYLQTWLPTPEVVDDQGQPDPGFLFYSSTRCVSSIGMDSEERLLVRWCELKNGSAYVSRILKDGSLDEGLGDRGELLLGDASPYSNGFLALGEATLVGGGSSSAGLIFKLNDTGIDQTFGLGGRLELDASSKEFEMLAVEDEFLVISRATSSGLVEKFDDRGEASLDFGESGVVELDGIASQVGLSGFAAQASVVDRSFGRVVIAGQAGSEGIGVIRIWL